MTDQIKQFWTELEKHQRILMHFHVRPDGDSVGSTMAMKLYLEKLGKTVTVISGDDPPIQNFNFLKDFNSVKNVNVTQINFDDFDLLISIDSSKPEQITRKIELKFPLRIPTIKIDHHALGSDFGDMEVIDPTISSASEIVYEILSSRNIDLIDKDIANYLYLGIWSDTLGFSTDTVTSRTYEIVTDLVKRGTEFNMITNKATHISVKNLQVVGWGLGNSKEYCDSKIIVTKLPIAVFKKYGVSKDEIGETKAQLAYLLSRCSDKEMTIVIYEYETNRISISMRNNNPDSNRDLTLLAKELGGGGHKRAAGGKFEGNVDDAEKLFLEKLQQIYPDLGQS